MAWRRKRQLPDRDQANDHVTARMVIARLEAVADRQEAVYNRLIRLLSQVQTPPAYDRPDKDT